MFAQLVCEGCRKILTYPYGALSCRCRNCGTVNASQNLVVDCPHCTQVLLTPINTLTLLCPCCATVIDIPESMLPRLEEPIDIGGGPLGDSRTMYVSFPGRPTTEAERARHKKLEVRRRRREQWERENMQRRFLKQPPLPPLSDSSDDDDRADGGEESGDGVDTSHAQPTAVTATKSTEADVRVGEREEREAFEAAQNSSDAEETSSPPGESRQEATTTAPPSRDCSPVASARYPLSVVIATRIL